MCFGDKGDDGEWRFNDGNEEGRRRKGTDEPLFSSIPLVFVYPLDSCSVLNCSSLECFSSVGLYWAIVPNLD